MATQFHDTDNHPFVLHGLEELNLRSELEEANLSYLLIAVNQDDAEIGRSKLSSRINRYVVPQSNVLNMDGDGGICSNTMFFHQRNQFRFRQVVRG